MAIAAEPVIGFLVDENPLAFHCVGDESVLCCGFPQNTEVIAFGDNRRVSPGEQANRCRDP